MKENTIEDIIKRVQFTFGNPNYKKRVDSSDKRWLDEDIDCIFETIIKLLHMINEKSDSA